MRSSVMKMIGRFSVAIATCSTAVASSQGLEQSLQGIVGEVVAGSQQSGVKRLTVADFTNLKGEITELGRFVAEELGTSLVMARPSFGVIDRANLRAILAEHKLSVSGLVDRETTKKLGQIAGVDAIITGTIVPMADVVHVTVKVISTETAAVVAASRSTLPRTSTIEQLLAGEISDANGTVTQGAVTALGRYGEGQASRRNPAFETPVFRFTIRSFNLVNDYGSSIRVGAIIENLTDKTIYLNVPNARLIGVESSSEWRLHPDSAGILYSTSVYAPPRGFTEIAPGVPAVVTLVFIGGEVTPTFDLTGTFAANDRGQEKDYPFTITSLVVSE